MATIKALDVEEDGDGYASVIGTWFPANANNTLLGGGFGKTPIPALTWDEFDPGGTSDTAVGFPI